MDDFGHTVMCLGRWVNSWVDGWMLISLRWVDGCLGWGVDGGVEKNIGVDGWVAEFNHRYGYPGMN